MAQIAERCGFPNRQRFRLVFTRLVGRTPTAYRRDLGEQRRGSSPQAG
jgi:AraC-like DNA-binding protein